MLGTYQHDTKKNHAEDKRQEIPPAMEKEFASSLYRGDPF
jgi:hypothetical protein